VAVPLWTVILYGRHLPPAFDAAVRHGCEA
jgi:cytochrome c oxidase assembly factor CtaG